MNIAIATGEMTLTDFVTYANDIAMPWISPI